ncbi:hypothetical protein [Streptomyces sp. NPDC088350]|uniref:hypothetical protein n=1 Tax=Streptomyces sp. NPDC088350 TaxID=3365854 RepID=UPI003801DC06
MRNDNGPLRRCYHLPDVTVPDGLPAEDARRLRETVEAAIRGAVRAAAPGETASSPASPRPQPRERVTETDRDSYAVPSYDSDGEKVGIPVVSPPGAAAPGAQMSPRDPANPHNTLTAREMYGIWQKHWVSRRNRAESRLEEARRSVWRKDAAAYVRDLDRFDLGHRDALGPEYRAAADERDVCSFMLSAKDQVHVWIEAQETLGKPVTFERVDAQAVEEARALGFRRTWIDPVVFSVLAAASYPAGPARPPATGDLPATPRLRPTGPAGTVGPAEPAGPGTPPAVATAPPRPVPPSGIAAWTRAWAVRFGLNRAMSGVDEAGATPRVAATSLTPTEQGTPPAPRRPPTTPTGEPVVAPVPEQAPTAPAVRRFDLTVTPLGPDEAFAQISDELAIVPSAASSGTGPAAAAADARAAGLIGPQGAPGTADLAVQRHADASDIRGAYGVSGGQVQSAHLGPTSFLRDVTGYSRGNAPTTLLPAFVHAAFDQHWKNWAIARRRAGDTEVTVEALYAQMLVAVDRIPLLTQETRDTIAWAIHRELFYDLGLAPGDLLTLPYPNVPPTPSP